MDFLTGYAIFNSLYTLITGESFEQTVRKAAIEDKKERQSGNPGYCGSPTGPCP